MREINKKQISKFLSLILRHKPEEIGITLDANGWAEVEGLIAKMDKRYPIDKALLKSIVAEDEKGRYAFNADGSKIRAQQGHSLSVDMEFEEHEPPEYLYHGTATRFVASIRKEGLLPQSRQYVHLSKDVATATKVGQRHGSVVVLTIRVGAMHRAGYAFYLSGNGVWLTKEVPAAYIAFKE